VGDETPDLGDDDHPGELLVSLGPGVVCVNVARLAGILDIFNDQARVFP